MCIRPNTQNINNLHVSTTISRQATMRTGVIIRDVPEGHYLLVCQHKQKQMG